MAMIAEETLGIRKTRPNDSEKAFREFLWLYINLADRFLFGQFGPKIRDRALAYVDQIVPDAATESLSSDWPAELKARYLQEFTQNMISAEAEYSSLHPGRTKVVKRTGAPLARLPRLLLSIVRDGMCWAEKTMRRKVILKCGYREHMTGHVASHWATICDHHEGELTGIRGFTPGSFNLKLRDPRTYAPPRDRELKEEARKRGQCGGNHISQFAKVRELNGKPVEAWLYRGGHPNDSLELLSRIRLRDFLGVADGAEVIVIIEEYEQNA